jgi:hypothetical protein
MPLDGGGGGEPTESEEGVEEMNEQREVTECFF